VKEKYCAKNESASGTVVRGIDNSERSPGLTWVRAWQAAVNACPAGRKNAGWPAFF